MDVVSVEWQRVGFTVRLQGGLPAPDDPGHVRLTRSGRRPGHPVAPVAETHEGDTLTLRFDLMRGPRRQPVGRGTWTLTDDRSGRPTKVRVRLATAAPVRFTRSLRLPHARYDAVVLADDRRAALTVTVAIDPLGGRIARRWPAWRIGRRFGVAVEQGMRRSTRRLLLGVVRRTTHRTGRRIVFASAARSGLSGNLGTVHDRMVERGLGATYELVRLGLRPTHGPLDRLRERWRSARILFGADVILVAGSRQRAVYGLGYAPDVRFIQLWHASGAFKTVGFSRAGQDDAPDPFGSVHREYTHAIVSSAHDVPFYAEAFGIPDERVIPTGIPRMSRFFDAPTRAAAQAATTAAFPMTAGHPIWLFAPTYRGEARAATYAMDRIDFAGLHRLAAERDAIVIFKMHPFVTVPVPIPAAMADRLVDGTRTKLDVNDLLFAVDLLITDYSSIMFEYSVLGRPMLFYGYDLDAYVAGRDFYVPFEAFVPGRIVRTSDALLDAIRREDYEAEKVAAFVAAHFAHLDGSATDRIIDDLVLAH